jgi:hypothetical protein
MVKSDLELYDFSHDIYGSYEDLRLMKTLELENHFFSFGLAEGRVCSRIKNRKDFVESIISKGKILEIGPLDNPQLDYRSPLYYSLDVFTKEQLINNYINDPNVNKEKIIEPSYVIADNDYSPIKEKFGCVFSSHNIEHVPCIVTFLNNLHELLSDDGHIYLIIPDKRYCFDHFKKETEIYDVLQAFFEKNSRPRFSNILKMVSQSTHNNCVDHWNNNHGTINKEADVIKHYAGILGLYNSGVYVDSHVSFFTPQNFIEIIGMLNELKLINLKIHKIYHTLRDSNEFYAILKKT